MRVLSLTATSRLAERCIRLAGEPMLVSDLIARLESLDVDTERAQAGVRLAVTVGRLEAIEDKAGEPWLSIPNTLEAAA